MGIVQNLRDLVDDERPRDLMIGHVISISTNSAKILLTDGSLAPPARIVKGLRRDDTVIIARPTGSSEWFIIAIIDSTDSMYPR